MATQHLDSRLALHGGAPVRTRPLPYGRQLIEDRDIAAVAAVLRSDWLTTGPVVEAFERAFAEAAGAAHGVAVANGTAALHAAMHAARVAPGSEVIVPALTFAATANSVVYEGGTPVFADIDEATLLVDPGSVRGRMNDRTVAVAAVDFAGQPCDYAALRQACDGRPALMIADACHAAGATSDGRRAGSLADLTAFSFHPVKHITTGEGGMVTTNDDRLAAAMRRFRNHGITTDHRQRAERGAHSYEMVELGFNYRLTDLQCALGLEQLQRLPAWVARRQALAARYDAALSVLPEIVPQRVRAGVSHAYHLYVVQLRLETLTGTRDDIYAALRAEGIGVNVHYLPVHLHPFYRERFGTGPGLCPVAERVYPRLLTLPMYAGMSDDDADDVIAALHKVVGHYRL